MHNKWDLQREVGSLDMLISALTTDLIKVKHAQRKNESLLLKEMEEALCELRQARGMTKVLLLALTNRTSQTDRKPSVREKKAGLRICH